jgi:hypothetical protein
MSIGPLTGPLGVSRKEVVVLEENLVNPSQSRVVIREYDPFSNAVIGEEFIDMRLAPGNPELAAQIHESNKATRAAQMATLVAPGYAVGKGLGFVGAKVGSKVGVPSVKKIVEGTKGAFVQPKIKTTQLPITPASRGLPRSQQQSSGVLLEKIGVEPTSLTKGLAYSVPGAGAYTALSSARTDPLTGDDLQQAEQDAVITKKQGDDIAEQLKVIKPVQDPNNIITTSNTGDTGNGTSASAGGTDQESADGDGKDNIKTLEQVGVDRFIDPDALISFVRNVGAGLTSTGQFGSGLAVGATMAAEERAKKEILETQEKKEMQKEEALLEKKFEYEKKLLEMKGSTPLIDPKEVVSQSGKLRDEIDAFNSSERARGLVEASIMVLEDAVAKGEKLTGVGGVINKFGDTLQALVSKQEGFDTLSSATKIDKLSEIVRTGNARQILDDPRLSNYEREIIGDVFGQLKTLEDPSIALGKFRNALNGLKGQNKSRKDLIITLHEGLLTGGNLGERSYIRTGDDVARIQSIDLDLSTAVETLDRLISGGSFGANVITLAE